MFWLVFDAGWFVLLFFMALSAPALFDLIRNPQSKLEIWPNRIVWQSVLLNGDRQDIDHVRLDRRFDGALKITLIHVGGAHSRLPPDITPPADAAEDALKAAGIAVERHPFTPF